eukprot:774574_1
MARLAANRPLRMRYTTLQEMNKEDWDKCQQTYNTLVMQKTDETLIHLLQSQRGDATNDKKFGMTVDLYEHALQTATRAYRDGASEETIIAASHRSFAPKFECENSINC